MLRKIRIPLAFLTITAVTLLFLGISWQCSLWISWVAKIQFLPALLALNVGVLAFLILLTLVFGRIYCSVVCPLGVMQDGFSWLGGKFRKNRFGYVREKRWLRYGVLVVFGIALLAGFAPLITLLAPYSAFGRIVGNLLRPLFDMLHNAAASWDANHGGFHFTEVDVWMRSGISLAVAVLTLVILGVWAWWKGRVYCNTICPVGTFLGLFSRFSLFRVRFDKDKCKKCGLCEKNCKASAIDVKRGAVDYSRCVACGDCLEKCRFDALHYETCRKKKCHTVNGKPCSEEVSQPATPESATPESASTPKASRPVTPESVSSAADLADTERRSFLLAAGMVTATAAMAQTQMKVDGGLALIENKRAPQRQVALTPPGSVSLKNMRKHCTACQLCVASCPNHVLRPSTSLDTFMQPVMSYERGYCRPECVRCSQVCPAGAIHPITPAEKTSVHVGHAVWISQNCLPLTEGVSCGNCARHCPTGAIQMVEQKGVRVPSVDVAKCIGCGACENLCPSRPFSAIYVEGNEVHQLE